MQYYLDGPTLMLVLGIFSEISSLPDSACFVKLCLLNCINIIVRHCLATHWRVLCQTLEVFPRFLLSGCVFLLIVHVITVIATKIVGFNIDQLLAGAFFRSDLYEVQNLI